MVVVGDACLAYLLVRTTLPLFDLENLVIA